MRLRAARCTPSRRLPAHRRPDGRATRAAMGRHRPGRRPDAEPPVPPSMAVWRSVRATGDTKTRLSRRTLALPARCAKALVAHREAQDRLRLLAGKKWIEMGLVFTTRMGTPLDAADVRRDFRSAIRLAPGIDPDAWTPRELRHSFVSLLSDSGVPIEEISRLFGHKSTLVTELVYRKQLRPVIQSGATVMDRLFASSWLAIWLAGPRKQQDARRLRGGTGLSPAAIVVGDTGIEPVTSSVSRKRSPTELIARARRPTSHASVEVETGFEPV